MLIPKEILVKATELTSLDIHRALQNSGYFNKAGTILEAEFKGMNPGGSFVYEITYQDDEEADGEGTGMVFVKIERKAMSKDFEFYAEY